MQKLRDFDLEKLSLRIVVTQISLALENNHQLSHVGFVGHMAFDTRAELKVIFIELITVNSIMMMRTICTPKKAMQLSTRNKFVMS